MAKRKSNQEFVSELLEKRPFIIPQEEYKGATVKIKVMSTKCGHSWYASPNNLLSGYGCPCCAGNKRKTNEEFVSELNEKSPKIMPLDEYVNTSTKIRAKCTICGNVWNVRPSDLLSGTGCPSCAKKKRATDENSITSLPILMQEWDYKKNENEDPDYVSRGSHKKVWWICSKCGFSWQTTVKSRVNGNGCPACSGHTLWPGYNDLETVNPELAYEWNYEKNEGLIPSNVYYNSKKSVWWKGTCGHEWEMRINERNSRGYGCPYCSGRRILPGFNDLATTNPLLAFEWNIEKNRDLSPTSVTAGSGKKAWWVCSICGHEWQAEISSRNKGRGCPRCATAYDTSFPEQAIFYYIKKYFDDAENGNRELGIELDIYIPSIKTAIEYDGYTWHVDKIEKDNEKDRLCTDAGIELIRVREKGLGKTITAFNIIRKDNYSVTDLEQSINVIIDKLGVRDCFVDIKKDRNAIITTYVTNIRNNNLASMKPELVENGIMKKMGR